MSSSSGASAATTSAAASPGQVASSADVPAAVPAQAADAAPAATAAPVAELDLSQYADAKALKALGMDALKVLPFPLATSTLMLACNSCLHACGDGAMHMSVPSAYNLTWCWVAHCRRISRRRASSAAAV